MSKGHMEAMAALRKRALTRAVETDQVSLKRVLVAVQIKRRRKKPSKRAKTKPRT